MVPEFGVRPSSPFFEPVFVFLIALSLLPSKPHAFLRLLFVFFLYFCILVSCSMIFQLKSVRIQLSKTKTVQIQKAKKKVTVVTSLIKCLKNQNRLLMLIWPYKMLHLTYLLTFRYYKIKSFEWITKKINFCAFGVTVVTVGEVVFELFTKN